MTNKLTTSPPTGNFGNLAQAYASGRMGIPNFIIDILWSMSPISNPKILDLGCGTGIPTRQLAQSGFEISATDIDAQMISRAEKVSAANIKYYVAPSNQLPFAEHSFDIATIFSAFHWFANKESLTEIKRVLKTGGLIFILNKNDVGDYWSGHRLIMEKYTSKNITKVKKDYAPLTLLNEEGFSNTETKDFVYSEWYSLDQMLNFLQSISIWNQIPPKYKSAALSELKTYCSDRMINNQIERSLKVTICSGYSV